MTDLRVEKDRFLLNEALELTVMLQDKSSICDMWEVSSCKLGSLLTLAKQNGQRSLSIHEPMAVWKTAEDGVYIVGVPLSLTEISPGKYHITELVIGDTHGNYVTKVPKPLQKSIELVAP